MNSKEKRQNRSFAVFTAGLLMLFCPHCFFLGSVNSSAGVLRRGVDRIELSGVADIDNVVPCSGGKDNRIVASIFLIVQIVLAVAHLDKA